jgi:hypothetical protein
LLIIGFKASISILQMYSEKIVTRRMREKRVYD